MFSRRTDCESRVRFAKFMDAVKASKALSPGGHVRAGFCGFCRGYHVRIAQGQRSAIRRRFSLGPGSRG